MTLLMTATDRLRLDCADALAGSGLLVDDLTLSSAGGRRVLTVVIDRDVASEGEVTAPVAPVSLDEIADATRLLDPALDEHEALGGSAYTLEVTSPGLSRPLREPRHFRRNVGRLLTVTSAAEVVTGRLVRAGERDLTLDVPPAKRSPGRQADIAYADVTRAVVELEFTRAAATPVDPTEPGPEPEED